MADEPIQPEDTPVEAAPADAIADDAPVVDAVDSAVSAPDEDSPPVEIVAPVIEPDDVSPDPPEDPIITDPVLPDAPTDAVFDVPLELLDPPAVAILETMPDDDKTILQTGIAQDYWGDFEHFQCIIPGCQRDFLSYAAMVSHVATEHQPADMDTPIGSVANRDRFNNLVGYEEV